MRYIKILLLLFIVFGTTSELHAQKKKKQKTQRTTPKKTKTNVKQAQQVQDSSAVAQVEPKKDSVKPEVKMPDLSVKKSLRPDEAVETSVLRDRTPLAYEHIRADDAVYRQRIWREINTREKFNQTFKYSADADNGNQRFISILISALLDSTKDITAFNVIDDRFTTPMTKSELVEAIFGKPQIQKQYLANGETKDTLISNEVNFDSSFNTFQIKEEVIFDKESSRLFWRILGIAPCKKKSVGEEEIKGLNDKEYPIFWIYYPDIRPILATYEVYNGKNFGGRMSWEELFESRMFSGRIIKSTYDNPFNQEIEKIPGLSNNTLLQLFEGENIKDKIFTYEQDLWSH
jgi:gliding motility associated protien GldN